MARKRRYRSCKFFSLIIVLGLLYFIIKIVSSCLPVEVVQAQVAELEDFLEGEFIVLRPEQKVAAPCSGYFLQVKQEGERVAKGALLGYLETTAGSSLEKTTSRTLNAPMAGLVSYNLDGLEQVCLPEIWPYLEIGSLAVFMEKLPLDEGISTEEGARVSAGEGVCKIINNLEECYFYWQGEGAFPEKIKKGGSLRIRLKEQPQVILKGIVKELTRDVGKYCLLIEILNAGNLSLQRCMLGEIIVENFKGVILPEKVIVEKEGQWGVYLFKKGRAHWQAVEKIAHLRGQVVLDNLTEKDWVIVDPQLVVEGKRVTRLNKK